MTDANEAEILEQFVRNQLEIKRLTEENDFIKSYYKQDGDSAVYGTRQVGKFYITTSRNARLDDKLFRQEYPPDANPMLYKLVPDTAAAKRLLHPLLYESAQKTFDPKIEIGLN